MSITINITSGKGGVGKSTLTANLGAALARLGSSVVLLDADIGLRSQDAFLGLESSVVYDIVDVAEKKCSLDLAILPSRHIAGLSLLPAAQFSRVRALDGTHIRKILKELKLQFDFILIDSPAGIESGFRHILSAGTDKTILIATPDDICLRDAERVCQILDAKHLDRPYLVVNRVNNDLIYHRVMLSARNIASILDLELLGEIPEDQTVYRSLLRHKLLLQYDCEASRAVFRIASRLRGESVPFPEYGKQRPALLQRLLNRKMKGVRFS